MQLTINRRWFKQWPSDPIHWRIYAVLGGDELIYHGRAYVDFVNVENPKPNQEYSYVLGND